MTLFTDLAKSLSRHRERHAFWIEGTWHTYADLIGAASRIRAVLRARVGPQDRIIGLVANDDLQTYAAIVAIWLEGKAYLPLAPATPIARNQIIISGSGIRYLLCSTGTELLVPGEVVLTDDLPQADEDLSVISRQDDDLAYLLYTSGTTGQPKGVPITGANLHAFCLAFRQLDVPMSASDRCLQMFELTFDLSVMSYLIPLLYGACAYTVPKNEIKYSYIAGMLEDHRITHALMVPSIINYLRPYFEEINAPDLAYSLFCGEALPLDVATEWSSCVPNARVLNVYGPTEHTIFCTHYALPRDRTGKGTHGILSIGRAMSGSTIVVMDEQQRLHDRDGTGELCLAGPQLTPGYWNDTSRTKESFFTAKHNGELLRFYRTGDLCSIDAEGDIHYQGRLDQQTKVQGYRVELAEVEHHARECLGRRNAVAVAVTNKVGNTEIALLIEGDDDLITQDLASALRTRLPVYMVPTILRRVATFPLNANGKTDRRALRDLVQESLA